MTQITTGPDGQALFDGMTVGELVEQLRLPTHLQTKALNAYTIIHALRHLSEWQPIDRLPERTNAEVGRWNGSGNGKFYWSSVSASWFTVNGAKEWTYERSYRKSPFYDDDGNYAEPTHFMLRPSPPPPPKGTEP